jgi:hypothetical protein
VDEFSDCESIDRLLIQTVWILIEQLPFLLHQLTKKDRLCE